jgi:hypothetical protein
MEADGDEPFLQAETAAGLVAHIEALARSPGLAETLARKAYAYAEDYNRQNLDPLLNRIENHRMP